MSKNVTDLEEEAPGTWYKLRKTWYTHWCTIRSL